MTAGPRVVAVPGAALALCVMAFSGMAARRPAITSRPLPIALVIANAFGDSIALEADTVADYREASGWRVDASSDPRKYKLANGRVLRLDRRTRVGRYDLKDGSRLEISAADSSARSIAHITAPRAVVFFRIRSRWQVGTLTAASKSVDVKARPADTVLARFARLADRYGGFRVRHGGAGGAAFNYPPDWYPHAFVDIPTGSRFVQMVWLAYGAEDSLRYRGYSPTTWAELRHRSLSDPLARSPRMDDPKSAQTTGRLIGEALVDPASRRVLWTRSAR